MTDLNTSRLGVGGPEVENEAKQRKRSRKRWPTKVLTDHISDIYIYTESGPTLCLASTVGCIEAGYRRFRKQKVSRWVILSYSTYVGHIVHDGESH